jgi:flavodoxin
MKILVTYSSLTGNTEKVALAVKDGLPEDASLIKVNQELEPDNFDLIFVGFWVDKGVADQAAKIFLEKVKNKKIAFLFTLGAYPDSDHAKQVALETEKLLLGQDNQVLGHFGCHGKVDPNLLEKMKKMLPEGHPHATMTPERQARLDEAAKHPNEQDLQNAKNFAQQIMTKV